MYPRHFRWCGGQKPKSPLNRADEGFVKGAPSFDEIAIALHHRG